MSNVSNRIIVPATLAECVREGLHIEMSTAAERVASMTERPGEWPMEIYDEPLRVQREAQWLLERIGGVTPDPPIPFEVDFVHFPILLRVLLAQQRSYIERIDEMQENDQYAVGKMVQELDILITNLQADEQTIG